MRYRCTVCDYIYDPEEGDPEGGVPLNTPFEELPEAGCARTAGRRRKCSCRRDEPHFRKGWDHFPIG
ncbi:MAG: rubredoxin [Methanomassiliicoccales archaeon]